MLFRSNRARRRLSKSARVPNQRSSCTSKDLPTETPAIGTMSTNGELPEFFKSLGSGSPKPRQKFCGMFCPVEGSADNKTLNFESLPAGKGKNEGWVIDKQTDISQARRVEIRKSTGKEALQNLDDKVRFCALSLGYKTHIPLFAHSLYPSHISF